MRHEIFPSKLQGQIKLPPSKSYVQRFIAAAIFAEGKSVLKNVGNCDDIKTAIDIAKTLGAEIIQTKHDISIIGGQSFNGGELFCRESGLCARLFTPIASVFGAPFVVNGINSLVHRNLAYDFVQLEKFGLTMAFENQGIPAFVEGRLRAGEYRLDCSKSSQMLSGLLFALPVLSEDSVVYADNLVSRPYVDMSLQILEAFGIVITETEKNTFNIKGNQTYHSVELDAEADWSAGANVLVAGALSGEIEACGLSVCSKQADKKILEVFKQAEILYENSENGIRVFPSVPQGFELDLTDCPDLFPAVLPLACVAKTISRFYHVERLIHKESNRLEAILSEYQKLGMRFKKHADSLEIYPSLLKAADVNSWGDHRMVMSLSIAGFTNQGLVIHHSEDISKSWADFFDQIKSIGGKFYAHVR